jgi:hypothetical protein
MQDDNGDRRNCNARRGCNGRAMPAGKGLGLAQTIELDGGDVRHSIVSECYLTKVCAQWGGGHICKEWTQKKVCGPPVNGSKAPPSTFPRLNRRP